MLDVVLRPLARARALPILAAALLSSGVFVTSPAAAAPPPAKRILVSLEDRRLWLVQGSDTLMSAPIAIGRGGKVTYGGKSYEWGTPRGERRVLRKRENPLWTVPEWHYYERAAAEGLEVVKLQPGRRFPLADSSYLEVRGDQVGRVSTDGRFWAIQPGLEIIIDGKIYMPPEGSALRKVPLALGTRALDLGDGYLIHGTHEYNADSIGEAASHGCIRMRGEDVERLFELVPVGTTVRIF